MTTLAEPLLGLCQQRMKARNLQEWREAVLERANHTCQKCGVTEIELLAHHIHSPRFYPKLKLETSNGKCLCRKCHRKMPAQINLFSWIDNYGWYCSPLVSKQQFTKYRSREVEMCRSGEV